MNILKRFTRIITYILICLAFYSLVKFQQNRINKQRNAEVMSVISQWQKNGKPVKTIKVKRMNFPQFSKFTIMSVKNNQYISYVTGQTASELKVGQSVYGSLDRRHLIGKITYVADSINFDKGLFEIRIETKNITDTEQKNMVIFAHTKTDKNVLWLPIDAVDFDKDGKNLKFFVWTVKNGKAHKTRIKESKVSETGIQIESGVTEGTDIVLNGKTTLKENDQVDIIGEDK